MPALPIAPEQQAEIDTLKLITSTLRKRGSYTEPMAAAVRALNAECARIFHAPVVNDRNGA